MPQKHVDMLFRNRQNRRPGHLRLRLAVLAIAYVAAPAAVDAAEHYVGEAYARNGTLLYRELHWLYREGNSDARLVLYVCPDGTPFARKHVLSRVNAQSPDFELDDARDGFDEGVRTQAGIQQVFVHPRADAAERSAVVAKNGDTVIDAGFDAFVRDHWDALAAANGKVALSFVVPSRLTALDFQVSHIGEERIGGREARRFRLGLARWYGGLLPHIDVVYDIAARRLLRYEGVSNIRDANARNLDVRIEFPFSENLLPASDAEIAAATNAALSGGCNLP